MRKVNLNFSAIAVILNIGCQITSDLLQYKFFVVCNVQFTYTQQLQLSTSTTYFNVYGVLGIEYASSVLMDVAQFFCITRNLLLYDEHDAHITG